MIPVFEVNNIITALYNDKLLKKSTISKLKESGFEVQENDDSVQKRLLKFKRGIEKNCMTLARGFIKLGN